MIFFSQKVFHILFLSLLTFFSQPNSTSTQVGSDKKEALAGVDDAEIDSEEETLIINP